MLKTKITPKERYRLKKLHKYENELYEKGYNCIAGVDEVGIGPLAGPVVAAACILPKKFITYGINDIDILPRLKSRDSGFKRE